MFTQPIFDVIFQRLDGLLLVLERPVVQRQLLLLILLALTAELTAGWLVRLRTWVYQRFLGITPHYEPEPRRAEPDQTPDGEEAQPTGSEEAAKEAGAGRAEPIPALADSSAEAQTGAEPKSEAESEAEPVPDRRRRVILRRWLRALEHTYSPVLAILLGQLAIYGFQQAGWASGLIVQGLLFFWLLLLYRVMATVLYAWLTERQAIFYQRRILLPSFILVVIFVGSRLISGIVDLGQVRLFTFAENAINLGLLASAVTVFYVFLVASWLVEDLLNRFILPRLGNDAGFNNTIRTITGYLILTGGVLASLGTLGIDLSSLAIIGAGLSVGIGFGLQDLVGNFVSGILILFEQTIRPGDIVEVNGKLARVERLRIRSTTVRTFDNVEMIVPNQTLLTSSVTTYTHTDRRIRVRIDIGVSYSADPQTVRDALLEVAERHGQVMAEPEPLCLFLEYADSSMNFVLFAWVEDMSLMGRVASDLRFMIWREFQNREIEIPFPQQDIHIRSGIPWEKIMPVKVGANDTPLPLSPPDQADESGEKRLHRDESASLKLDKARLPG